MYQHLLVPIDDTRLGSMTVEQAVAFAGDARARITFLHVVADLAGTSDGSLLHTMDPAEFERAVPGVAHAVLARAEAAATVAGVPCDTVAAIGDHPHELIHAHAQARGCDLIFLASHGRRGLAGRLAGSVTGKLLQVTALPVLVARVEANAEPGAEQRAISVIKDEHRSIAAVLRALQSALADGAPAPDLRMLKGAIFYLGAFPERLHHRREEETLFHRLRQRHPASAAILDALESQHRDGRADFEALRAAQAAYEAAGPGDAAGRAAFAATVQAYAELQWTHMATEEREVLPLAVRHLSADDWLAIATAFESHQDPRFDTEAEAGFARVFQRLMDLAAAPART